MNIEMLLDDTDEDFDPIAAKKEEILTFAEENYYDPDRVEVYIDEYIVLREDTDPEEVLSDFEEAYAGEWDSPLDWAYENADDYVFSMLSENERNSSALVMYFNYEAWVRDIEIGGDMNFIPYYNGVIAFRNY